MLLGFPTIMTVSNYDDVMHAYSLGSNRDITDIGAKYLAEALEHGTSIEAVR